MPDQPTCQETVRLLPWFVNCSLGAGERIRVRGHLLGCAACRAELAQTRDLLELVRLQPTQATSSMAPRAHTIRLEAGRARSRARRTLPWWAAAAATVLAWISIEGSRTELGGEAAGTMKRSLERSGRQASLAAVATNDTTNEIVFSDNFDNGRLDRWNFTSQPTPQP